MRSGLREIMKQAEALGFEFDGYDGRAHPRLRHTVSGVKYSIALTPSDVRSRKNDLAKLRRIARAAGWGE